MAGLGLSSFTENALRKEFERDPERFKDRVLQDLTIKSLPAFEKALLGNPPFDRPQRWAFHLLWRAQKWVEADGSLQFAIALFQSVGVRDEAQLRDFVGLARSAEGVTMDQAYQEAITVIRLAVKLDPAIRAGHTCELCGHSHAREIEPVSVAGGKRRKLTTKGRS